MTGVAAGIAAARAMHTRAAGLTMMLLVTGAALRLVAYMTLQRGAEAGDTSQYGVGLAISTASLVFEALAYLVAALWLATRGGMSGKVLVNVALGIAICLAWLASQSRSGQGADARSVLQVALTTSGSHGLPNRLPWLGRFLAVLSPMLAGAFVAQWRHASLVVAGIGLAILSRGTLDVPLYTFLLVAGSLALVLAAPDKRSMWTQLIAAKK
jgi:small-conductance mechanosensitive channel